MIAPLDTAPLLAVEDLVVDYRLHRKLRLRALKGVSLSVGPGECVGLVGESGSGKSTLGKAVLGLAAVTSGRITFDGEDITHARGAARRRLANDIQVVFQDPYGSLDPTMTVGEVLAEPLVATGTPKARARAVVAEMLDHVRLPADALHRYPSEFSGGQRQRIAIARALVRKPRLIVCDEPVSALDLTTQATILDLFIDIQRETGVSYLFVSHDLGVVRRICHRVSVMYHGEIVESGDTPAVTREPQHPYTRRLLLAAPVADPARQAERRSTWLGLRDSA
ncbi:ABC transporter ATP-binding protein [Saccharothrix algeriensis]|uniref:ABC transporter ATP-binding protein n=1 Tax=Saccharothrix algeriensis TaxID=173560 RepID=A0A8T8I1H4_9PSEU|nr:ABC transporter ATP-binding protein [Saccharothrix algeriensis]MBM7810396.1 ABC-type glutathione transport system ATPase component [Saccharothrix algeriensis]QTR04529.1 ABC transporter ATP-binding protein [Saccharothrix algeriensis]